jgi:hypothetical protein
MTGGTHARTVSLGVAVATSVTLGAVMVREDVRLWQVAALGSLAGAGAGGARWGWRGAAAGAVAGGVAGPVCPVLFTPWTLP